MKTYELLSLVIIQFLLCAAHAENQCADLQTLVNLPQNSLQAAYEPQLVEPENTLDAAIAVAKRFRITRASSFLTFPESDQLRYLNEANHAVSKLPPLVLQILDKAGFNVVLVKDKLTTVPELAATGGAYPYPGFTAGSNLRNSYVVVNSTRPDATVEHVTIHELGHAFSHSIGIIRAKVETNPKGIYSPYTFEKSDFDKAYAAAAPVIKGSPIASLNEFFPEMFYYYFGPADGRERLSKRLPDTLSFFENWFGESCRK